MIHPLQETTRCRTSKPRHLLVQALEQHLHSSPGLEHLLVHKRGNHLYIAHPGSIEAPDQLDPVLRLTHIGSLRYGLSIRLHTGRWEPVPLNGTMEDVLMAAVKMFGPWLEQR